MSTSFVLSDSTDLQDVATFLTRSASVREGVCRVVARGRVAALHVAASFPMVLTDPAPVIIGQRGIRLTQQTEPVDVVVPLRELRDRLPRAQSTGDGELRLPPQRTTAAWASLVPLQVQWQPAGTISDDQVIEAAAAVSDRVRTVLPDNPGQPVVVQARAAVWGKTLLELGIVGQEHQLATMLAGAAFVAQAYGFVKPGERSRIFVAGAWQRISAHGGTLLYRAGLTA